MKSIINILLPVILISFFTSCGLSNQDGLNIDMEFRSSTPEISNELQMSMMFNGDTLIFRPWDGSYVFDKPPFKSNISSNQIKITGYFLAGYTMVTPKATIESEGNKITVHVYMPPYPYDVSPSLAVPFIYDLYLSGIPNGEYDIVILHSDDTMRPSYDKYKVFEKGFVIGEVKTE